MKKVYIVSIILIIICGVYYYITTKNVVDYKSDDICSTPQAEQTLSLKEIDEYCSNRIKTNKSELDKIMEEEQFKKETQLRARKLSNDRKKKQEEIRHKDSMDKIEAEYTSIRAEELQLVEGKANVSLK